MRHFTHPGAILAVGLLLAGCGDASPPTASLAGRIQAQAQANRSDIAVNLLDACDAATFNAAVGPGTCSRPGG